MLARCSGAALIGLEASAVAVEVLQEFLTAPSRTLLNLNVPNLRPHELKGVRRGRISMAGVVKSARPHGDVPLEDKGRLDLRLGAATPDIGDVSDENEDEDDDEDDTPRRR